MTDAIDELLNDSVTATPWVMVALVPDDEENGPKYANAQIDYFRLLLLSEDEGEIDTLDWSLVDSDDDEYVQPPIGWRLIRMVGVLVSRDFDVIVEDDTPGLANTGETLAEVLGAPGLDGVPLDKPTSDERYARAAEEPRYLAD